MENKNNIDQYWSTFLQAKNLAPDTKRLDVFHFELTEKWANILLDLVLQGKKRATCSSLVSFEQEGIMPKEGDYSIVTDWDGNPRCVIQTVKVTHMKFKDMTFAICSKEGEDDSLESWRNNHISFFTREGKEECGYEFSEDMPIVFEEFEVVYQ